MFSTHLGQYAPRAGCDTAIILRSSPEDDQESMIVRLRHKFPKECKDMTSLQPDIFKYFDPYDAHRHGSAFLYSVLATIALQNKKRVEYVQQFAKDWGRNNPEKFNGLRSQTPDFFTELDHQEYGDEFLADVFMELRCRKSMMSQSCRAPTIHATTNETCHFDFNPYNSIPSMHTSQPHCYTPSVQPRPNYIRPQIPIFPPECKPSTQTPNDLFSNRANLLDHNQSSARHDFNSGPETYTNEELRPEVIDTMAAVTSQLHSGSLSCHQVQPDPRNNPPPRLKQGFAITSQSHSRSLSCHQVQPDPRNNHPPRLKQVSASMIPNPRKLSTDDARVLEIQETVFQGQAPLRNMGGPTTFQYSAELPSQIRPLDPEDSQITNPSLTELGLQEIVSGHPDPAVLYAPNQINGGSSAFHVKQYSPPTLESAAVTDTHIPKYSIHAKVLDTKTYTVTEAHRPYRLGGNAEVPGQGLSSSGQLPKQNDVNISPQNHGSSAYWKPKGEWPPQHVPPAFLNAGNPSFQERQRQRTNSGSKIIDKHKVWVGGLAVGTSESSIQQLFEKYGQVTAVSIIRGKDKYFRFNSEFAFVTFESAIDAAKAVKDMRGSRFGSGTMQVRSAYEQIPRPEQYQYQNRDDTHHYSPGWSMNGDPRQIHQVGRKEESLAMWMTDSGNKPIYAPDYISEDTNMREQYGTNTPTRLRHGILRNPEDLATGERQNEQTPRKRSSLSRSKSNYSRRSSFTPKQDGSIATELTPLKRKTKNPSKSRRNGKPNIAISNEENEVEEAREISSDTPAVDLYPKQQAEHLDLTKSPHQQFATGSSSAQIISSVDSTGQEHNEPSNSTSLLIRGNGEILGDTMQPIITNFCTTEIPVDFQEKTIDEEEGGLIETSPVGRVTLSQSEQGSSLAAIPDSTIYPQPERLTGYASGAQISLEPSLIRDAFILKDAKFGEQEVSGAVFSGFRSLESTAKTLEGQANKSENVLRVESEQFVSHNPTMNSEVRDRSFDEVSDTTVLATPISPSFSTIHDSDSSASQIELGANLAGGSTVLAIAKSSIGSSCSDQMKAIVNQPKPRTPPISSTVTSPSAAIVTHKKKKKSFPSNNDSDESRDISLTLQNEELAQKNPADQPGKTLEASQIVESSLCMKNIETTTSALSKQDLSNFQLCSAPKSSQSPKAMGKRNNKSKRKGKLESEKATSKSSALPTPATPYLHNSASEAGDTVLGKREYVPPSVDSYNELGSTAVNPPDSETQHLINDERFVPSIGPYASHVSRTLNLPEPETPYLVNDEHIVPAIRPRIDSGCERQLTKTNRNIRQFLENKNRFLRKSDSPEHNSQQQKTRTPSARQAAMSSFESGIGGYQQLIPSPRIWDTPLKLGAPSGRDLGSGDKDFEMNKGPLRSGPTQVSEKIAFSQEQTIIKATPSTSTSEIGERQSCPEPSFSLHTAYTPTAPSSSSKTESEPSGPGHIDADSFDGVNMNIITNSASQEAVSYESLQAQKLTSPPQSPTDQPRFPRPEAGLSPDGTKPQSEFESAGGLESADGGNRKSIADDTRVSEGRVEENNGEVVFGRAGVPPARAKDPWILPRGEQVWGKSGKRRWG